MVFHNMKLAKEFNISNFNNPLNFMFHKIREQNEKIQENIQRKNLIHVLITKWRLYLIQSYCQPF